MDGLHTLIWKNYTAAFVVFVPVVICAPTLLRLDACTTHDLTVGGAAALTVNYSSELLLVCHH